MALKITKNKKSGKYSVYSTISDGYLLKSAGKNEVISFYIKRAAERADFEIKQWLNQVDRGEKF